MVRRVVGSVNFPYPQISTNTRFFNSWRRKGDFICGAAHWIHEWLHVAGFLHQNDVIDENDINYTVGRIAVEIGRELYKDKIFTLLEGKAAGQSYN